MPIFDRNYCYTFKIIIIIIIIIVIIIKVINNLNCCIYRLNKSKQLFAII